MRWRERLITRFGSGGFSGITFGLWVRVLRENGFSVDPPYWGRAAVISLASLLNVPTRRIEDWAYGRKVEAAEVASPLFVLGIWRSGTTHLHNLLCRDRRFAYPNFYQCVYPHTFLCTEQWGGRAVAALVPDRRPQDEVRLGVGEPQEDELALCSLLGRSILVSLAFPRRAEAYDRYLTLDRLTDAERREWRAALRGFLKKLSLKYGRPLVLKSPGHTARIRVLLEMFPDARFIHLRRNPYAVFQSSRHTVERLAPWWALQDYDYAAGDLDGRTLHMYREVSDAFFEQRGLIPPGRLHEMCFEDLEADAIGEMRKAYKALGLPDFAEVEPDLRRYLESLSRYRKNAFPPLPAELRERIAVEWRRCFEEWGYPM